MPIIVDPNFVAPPPPTEAESADGLLAAKTDPIHGGARLKADYSEADPLPERVRFFRGDGSPVRGGDPAWAPGGVALAYDHEASLGNPTAWYAVPVYRDGSEGDPTLQVALELPKVGSGYAWLKPVAEPAKSMRAKLALAEDQGRQTRTYLSSVAGSPFLVGAWDVPIGLSIQVTFETNGRDEYDKLLAALSAGPILFQADADSGLESDVYLIATGGLAATRMAGAETGFGWDARHWPIDFNQVDRPATVDAPYIVPGMSWDDIASSYSSWTALEAQVPTWLALNGWG